jgi:hypothetical protein
MRWLYAGPSHAPGRHRLPTACRSSSGLMSPRSRHWPWWPRAVTQGGSEPLPEVAGQGAVGGIAGVQCGGEPLLGREELGVPKEPPSARGCTTEL